MPSDSGSSGSFSKFSLIKARLRSDDTVEAEPPAFGGAAPSVGGYVAGVAFKPTTPRPADDFSLVEPPENPSSFRATPLPPVTITTRIPAAFSKSVGRTPQARGRASSSVEPEATPPPSPRASPVQKVGRGHRSAPGSSTMKKAESSHQSPRASTDITSASEAVIFRPRAPMPSPSPRATVAEQVKRVLDGIVGDIISVDVPSTVRPASSFPTSLTPTPMSSALTRTPHSAASVEAFMEGMTDGASLKERELAVALRNLQRAGWGFQTLGEDQADGVWVDAAGAYRFLLDERRSIGAAEGEVLRIIDPRGEKTSTVSAVDEAASLDYFGATGDPHSLKFPALAKKLQELAATGLQTEGDNARTPGIWGAYVALTRGERAVFKIEGVVFGEVRGGQPGDLERAADPLADLLALYRGKLLPVAAAGRLRRFRLGNVLETLRWDVPGVGLEERCDAYLRLLDAVSRGPDAHSIDIAEQAVATARAYGSILELDIGGTVFWEAVATMEALVAVVGADRAKEPLHFMYREVGRKTPFREAREEHEQVFRRVLACGLDPHDAISTTQQIVMRPWDEPLEERVQLFEALAELSHSQPGYARVLHDFETVLRYRSRKRALSDAARSYLAIFRALVSAQKGEETALTYAFLHEGVRRGHLDEKHASAGFDDLIEGLADRFVELFGHSGDAAEARRRLLYMGPGETGRKA